MTPRPYRVAAIQPSLDGLGDSEDTARARAQGAVARASGRAFEDEIERQDAWLAERGIAKIEKHGPRVEGFGKSLHVAGRGPFDWSGVARGWPVAFETKVITGSATYTHEVRKLHQVQALLHFERCGGLAFLLLHDRELDLCWVLRDVAAIAARGSSVPVRTKRRDGTLLHHLPVLRRQVRYPTWDWPSVVAPDTR